MKFTGCFALIFLAACGPTVEPVPPVEPPHLLWSSDPQSLENPFPDTRLLTTTGAALRTDFYRPFIMAKTLNSKMRAFFAGYASAAATDVHGFGNFGPTLLRTSIPVDPKSLMGTVARLRKTAAGYEVLEASLAVEHSTDVLIDTGKTATSEFPEFFLARPSVPLPEGEEGLVVVKKGLKGLGGEPFGRGFAWEKARPDLKAIAAALKIAEDDVLLVLPQKAAPVLAELKGLAAWVDTAAGVPAVTIPAQAMVPFGSTTRPVGVWSTTDPGWGTIQGWLEKASFGKPSASVAKVVIGSIAARDLRENGIWRADWVADPTKAPVIELPFVLSIPIGARPSGGWPTAIGAHGLGGRNLPMVGDGDSYCLEQAEVLASQGIACLGIDAPTHGLRGNFIDFFEIDRLTTIRDRFREMTFDLLQLCRAAPNIDVDGDAVGDLEPQLGYLGNSLGAIMGSGFVPVAPRIQYAVLNVPGAGLSNILVSHDIRDRIGLLLISKTGGSFDTLEYYSSFMIFRAIAQPFLEAADPINLAAALPTERAVLVQEGIGDLVIPNFTTENLKGAMKLAVPVANVIGSTPLQVISHEDPAAYLSAAAAKDFNGHEVWTFGAVRAQAQRFLKSRGREYQVP